VPELRAVEDVFAPIEVETRVELPDGTVDRIVWHVKVDFADSLVLKSALYYDRDDRVGRTQSRWDLAKIWQHVPGCIFAWVGVTDNGIPIPWDRKLLARLPLGHQQQLLDAFVIYAAQGEFPNSTRPAKAEETTVMEPTPETEATPEATPETE
jgi:hypothetical protein